MAAPEVKPVDKNNQSPAIDPVDLLNEHYEDVNMRDDFRRDLQIKSRSLVAARHRMPMIRWAVSLSSVAAVIALFMLAWHFFYSVPDGNKAIPAHQRSANVERNTASPNKDIINVPRGAEETNNHPIRHPRKPRPNIDNLANIPLLGQPKKQLNPATPKQDNTPLVAIVSIQQPVKDERGKVLNAGDRIPAGVSIRTGSGGRVTLVTRKGSELHLDSNSELVLSSSSIATISRGRLYCSNRDKEIARIDTPAGQVKLLGTVVDTAIVRKDTAAVTVVEGKVRITNAHGSALVDAGKRSVLVAYRPPQTGIPVNTYKETAWYHGKGEYQSDFGDIAYTVSRENSLITELWTMKADGGGKHRVRSFIGGYTVDPGSWLPGARWLNVELGTILWTTPDLNTRTAHAGAGHPILGNNIVLLDAVTGQTAPNDLPEGYSSFYRSIAPDPTRMAFTGYYVPDPDDRSKSEGGVWIHNSQSGEIKHVLSGDIKTAPAWAPDGRHIAISSGQGYTNDHNLLIIDTDTGQARELGINGAGASFSPNGSKIAYTGEFQKGGSWYAGVPTSGGIFVLDLAPGCKPVRVSPEGQWATRPRWSPDGTHILYITSADQVCVVGADGAGFKQVYGSEHTRIDRASWESLGDLLFVSVRDSKTREDLTLMVAADGSGVKRTLNQSGSDSRLSKEAERQTNGAVAAIKEAIFQFAMGKVHSFESDIAARRKSYTTCADIFSRLVWDYPLSGLGTDDTLRYADVAAKEAASPAANVLHDSCKERMQYLGIALANTMSKYHLMAPDLPTLLKWSHSAGWMTNWLRNTDEEHVKMLGGCPGSTQHSPASFVYTPPEDGAEPNVGDILIKCPLHSDIFFKWDDYSAQRLSRPLMKDGKRGDRCEIRNTPYRFENVGDTPLTIIYHALTDKYEIQGQARLLPTSRVYTNEELSLPTDEGAIGRDIDAAVKLDWGSLPVDEAKRAENDLIFCRCVAQFESGHPVTDSDLPQGNLHKTFDGEPARLLFSGPAGGSCGAFGSDLRFELIGPGDIQLYQLKPSGRFRVFGTVRVLQTKQVCKNGWIDKDGKVISTEK